MIGKYGTLAIVSIKEPFGWAKATTLTHGLDMVTMFASSEGLVCGFGGKQEEVQTR